MQEPRLAKTILKKNNTNAFHFKITTKLWYSRQYGISKKLDI